MSTSDQIKKIRNAKGLLGVRETTPYARFIDRTINVCQRIIEDASLISESLSEERSQVHQKLDNNDLRKWFDKLEDVARDLSSVQLYLERDLR